jgi:hypothetical protein
MRGQNKASLLYGSRSVGSYSIYRSHDKEEAQALGDEILKQLPGAIRHASGLDLNYPEARFFLATSVIFRGNDESSYRVVLYGSGKIEAAEPSCPVSGLKLSVEALVDKSREERKQIYEGVNLDRALIVSNQWLSKKHQQLQDKTVLTNPETHFSLEMIREQARSHLDAVPLDLR